MEFLRNKKTNIIALLMVVVGVVQGLTGDVAAWQGVMDNAVLILNGLGLGALRAGVAKISS
jgi:hypothetical protein|tara:strand:+ start:5074 stop:5256 length:183 start_codon:yes stop_codon:yes gene_type:complete